MQIILKSEVGLLQRTGWWGIGGGSGRVQPTCNFTLVQHTSSAGMKKPEYPNIQISQKLSAKVVLDGYGLITPQVVLLIYTGSRITKFQR